MKILIFFLLTLVAFSKSSSYDDEDCDNQLNLFSNALESREFWALELFDSWAKINSGFLRGNVQNLGNFDQCRKFQYDTKSHGIIRGQYCMVTFRAINSSLGSDREGFDWREFANFIRATDTRLTNAVCLPDSCRPQKILLYLNREFLNKNDFNAGLAQCYDDNHLTLETIDIIAIVIFGLVFLTFINDTAHDLYKRSKNEEPHKFWGSFSLYTNGMKLFDITKSKSPSAINCMNGLRALSIFWIILGHRIYNQFPWGNIKDFQDFMDTPNSTIVKTHPIAVDTFFVLGAVLMTWSVMRDCEKGQLSIGRMIWRRYLRYTPAFAALILFVVSLSKYFAQGPFPASTLYPLRYVCTQTWWAALLHIQNFMHWQHMCLSHTWYLSADFQLFIISPFIVYFMHKHGKKLLSLPAILFGISFVYIISISVALGIPMPSPSATEEYLKWIYYPTQSRCGPWFIGMILGYFMYQHRGKTFKINPFLNAFVWIFTISLQITILLITFNFTVTRGVPQALHTTFMAFQRNLWALTICWIIFACQHLKAGGIVRWFLSLPQWQPIGRMGLSMYIIHPVYQVISMTNQRVPLYLNFWQFIPLYLSDIVITIGLATISYLAFEAPILNLEDYFYKKFKRNEKRN